MKDMEPVTCKIIIIKTIDTVAAIITANTNNTNDMVSPHRFFMFFFIFSLMTISPPYIQVHERLQSQIPTSYGTDRVIG
jgi:hypothetical protein